MPGIRGKVTSGEDKPLRVVTSDSLTPKALTRIRTQPGLIAGTGRSSRTRFATGPGLDRTIARMIFIVDFPDQTGL
ncbi:hypothetical protein D3C71_1441210 [compost metagenome]